MNNIIYSISLVTVITFLFSGCEESNVSKESVGSSFSLIQTKIFNTSCALSGCHLSEQDESFAEHKLILREGLAYENLVNVDAQNLQARDENLKRVAAGDERKSFLLHKLHCDHQHPGYGSIMPLGLAPLSNSQIEYISEWVKEGAPKEGDISASESLLDDNIPACEETFTPLDVPALNAGYQIKVEPFEVAPMFEREIFVYKEVGNEEAFYLKRVEMKMRRNSHHFLINTFASHTPNSIIPEINVIRDLRDLQGKYVSTTAQQMEYHLFSIASQTPLLDYTFPPGVALRVPAQHKVDVNLHYVNKSRNTIQGECYINLYKAPAEEVVHEAKTLFLSNDDILLNARQKSVIVKTFTAEKDMKIFMLTSHTHQMAEHFEIQIKGGDRNAEVIYSSSNWHHPVIKTFDTPVLIRKGEGLTMIVTYNNTTNKQVKYGLTSEDEMSIIYGYYF